MVKIENLNFSFGPKGFSLKNINLDLPCGTYALLGSNGSGKTTLMKCLTGSYAYRGRVTVKGGTPVGYLPQSVAFLRDLTVREMLQYLYCMRGIGKKIDQAEIDRCLAMTNLADLQDKKVKNLSGGMLRRLGVAQAILGDAAVLIFDEPTAGLDPEERMRFKNLIYSLNKNKDKVIIISTHIVDDVVGNCDSVIVLKDGAVLHVGSEEEITQMAENKVFFLPDHKEHSETLYIEKNVQRGGESFVRVLSSTPPKDGEPAEPTMEDGYLCLIKQI